MNKKMLSLLALLVLVLFSMSLLAGCGSSKKEAPKVDPAKKFVFKLGHTASPDHHYQVGSLKFAELVAKRPMAMSKSKCFRPTSSASSVNWSKALSWEPLTWC